MATQADELQNDFLDSGSDSKDVADLHEDFEMSDADSNVSGEGPEEIEEAAKQKSVGTVTDMRGVANFIRSIEPVLEVGTFLSRLTNDLM